MASSIAYTSNSEDPDQTTVNCDTFLSGQNKNRFVLTYLAWRVMTGQHHEITLMMQVAGHTRCLLDSGFAHIKKLYRRCDNDCLDEMASVVDKSAVSDKAVLYSKQDWNEFLGKNQSIERHLNIPAFQILQYFPWIHLFVSVKSRMKESFYLLKDGVGALEGLPDVIRPAGLEQ